LKKLKLAIFAVLLSLFRIEKVACKVQN